MRVAIVEDTPSDRETLRAHLTRAGEETGEQVQIDEFGDGMAFLEGYRPIYDIVFLDIEMPRMNGMDAARELREQDGEVLIIFITNVSQYALQGYAVDALDYVLKPVSYFAFLMKFKKAQRVLGARVQDSILLQVEGETRKTPLKDILYVEVRDHRLCYHTLSGECWAAGKLKAVEEELEGKSFCRCNNCYLVNLRHVRSVTMDEVQVDKERLKMSRPRRQAFMKSLSDFYGRGGR